MLLRVISNLILSLLILLPVLLIVAFLTLFERVVLAHIHRRSGPNMVGFQGLGQAIGDAAKLITKEYLQPIQSSTLIFQFSPLFTFIISIMNWSVLPFIEGVVIADLDIGLMFLLTLAMLGVYGVLMSGWASNSKYSLLGSLRSTAQMLGYDITVSLVLFSIVILTGSLHLTSVVVFQSGLYLGFVYPAVFLGALINGLAEVNRVPFDLPEAEPELVSGYNTEYSGIGFTLFFLAEYSSILVMSALLSLLFIGGWW